MGICASKEELKEDIKTAATDSDALLTCFLDKKQNVKQDIFAGKIAKLDEDIFANIVTNVEGMKYPYDNKLIIYNHLNEFEKKNELFMIIPNEIYEQIIAFCKNEYIVPSAPVIVIRNIYIFSDCVILNVSSSHQSVIKAQKIKYRVDNNEWNDIDITDNDYSIYYKINGLQASTKYEILVISMNKYNIYGIPSNTLAFTTSTKWIFDVITEGYDALIKNNGRTLSVKRNIDGRFVTSSYSKGYDSGIHRFKIKFVGDTAVTAFSIVSESIYKGTEWIRHHQGKHYYLDGGDGYIYCTDNNEKMKKAEKWKIWHRKNSNIVSMILDCNEWTLEYIVHNESYKINIEQNKIYYPCITTDCMNNVTIVTL